MSKKAAGRKERPAPTIHERRGALLVICLILSFISAGGALALWGTKRTVPALSSPAAAPAPASLQSQNSFEPQSPAKEYVYAGGRLVATEEPGRVEQTITFTQPADKTYGDAPFALNATSSSSLPVSFAITSGPATVSGSTLTITGAGTVSVTADQAGNTGYNPAQSVTRTFTVAKATPILSWSNPANITYGTALGASQLSATSSVAGTFVYVPALGTVLHVGVSQNLHAVFTPSDTGNYNTDSTDAHINVTKASLTVTAENNSRAYGDANPALTYVMTGFVGGDTQAGSTSGQAALSTSATESSPPGTYTITAVVGTLSSSDYAFSFAGGTLTVTKAGQMITFAALPNKTFGDADFAVSATASSSLTVGFAASGGCTVSGTTVHIIGAGNCTLTASQGGNANYNAATNVQQSFTIGKASSTTTVTASNATYDSSPHGGTAVATGAGGLNQSLTVSYVGRNGTTYGPLTTAPINAGDYTASATFGGDANHNGSNGNKDFSVAKATATITLSGLTQTFNGSPKEAIATTSPAGLGTVSFTYNGLLTPVPINAGSYAVSATLSNANYSAPAATGTLTINKATPTITWNNPADIAGGTALGATQLNATASTAGTFTYTPAAGTVLSVGNNQTLSVSFTPTDGNNYNGASATAHINVIGCPVAASSTFTGTTPIGTGTSSTLSWNVPSATGVTVSSIGGTLGPFGSTGSTTVTPPTTRTYTLSATGASPCQTITKQMTVVVQTCPTSANTTFTASSEIVAAGQSVDLTWAAQGATSVSIEQACDPQDSSCDPSVYEGTYFGGGQADGSVTVQPSATTVYTLTATGATGCAQVVTKQVTILVPGDAESCAPDAFFITTRVGQFHCASARLDWEIPDATSVTITGDGGEDFGTYENESAQSGRITVTVGTVTTFTLTAHLPTGGGVPASCSVIRLQATNPCAP